MRKLILFLMLASSAHAAVNASMQVNVRQDGSDNNGGGCDPVVAVSCAASPSASATVAYTDLTIGATTSQYTSVLHAVDSTVPGHMLHIVSGSGCTTGFYEILSQSAGTAVADRSMGSAASVCTANLDGALATVAESIVAATTAHMTINICGAGCGTGTYTLTTGLLAVNADDITFQGYNSAIGDLTTPCSLIATCPLIQSNTASINLFQTGSDYIVLNELSLLAQSSFTQYAVIVGNSANLHVLNSKVVGNGASNTVGIDAYHANNSYIVVENSEFTGWNYDIYAAPASGGNQQNVTVIRSYFHGDPVCVGDGGNFAGQGLWLVIDSVFDSCGYGIYMQSSNEAIAIQTFNSAFTNSTHDGINNQSSFVGSWSVDIYENDIFYGNGGWNVNNPFSGGCPAGNGDFGQISFHNGVKAGGSGGYQCVHSIGDVAITVSPFTSSSVFTLNSTAGGGAALKAAGVPGPTPMGTGYLDIGALQSAAAAASISANYAYVQ